MEVSQEVSSMVRGWLMASPSAGKRRQPPDYVPISPRPERLGLGAELCKGSNELDTVQRREMAVRMERKIVGRRRKHLDTNTVAAPRTELAWMEKSHSQDLSSDEECSRTAAVKMGRKMGGKHLQEVLLGGCERLPKRKRRKRERHKQVSETAVSEIVDPSNGSDKLLNCSDKLSIKVHMFQQPHEPSSSRVKKVERKPGGDTVLPRGDTVLQEDLSAETKPELQEKKKTYKRKKMKEPPLCSSKKHSKASLKNTGQDGQSSGESNLEEAAAERTQLEKLTPSVLQPAPHCELEQCNSKTASSLMAARKERMKSRMKNSKNSQKTQSNISTCPNSASDGDNQLQTMKDIAMETGVVTQRRINCGSRARRQLQRKAFLYQKRKLLERRRKHRLTLA